MKIVKTIRRMIALRDGISRCNILDTDGRYDEVWERLNDKYETLRHQLRTYYRCGKRYSSQVKLACRLLGVNYHNL